MCMHVFQVYVYVFIYMCVYISSNTNNRQLFYSSYYMLGQFSVGSLF